jgi:hypothetical protein
MQRRRNRRSMERNEAPEAGVTLTGLWSVVSSPSSVAGVMYGIGRNLFPAGVVNVPSEFENEQKMNKHSRSTR